MFSRFFSFVCDVLGISSLRAMFSSARSAVSTSVGAREIEQYLLRQTQKKFQPEGYNEVAQRAPDGSRWEPISPVTVERRSFNKKSTQALMDRGDLYLSISVLDEGSDYFSIGISGPAILHTIASFQQHGGLTPQGKVVPPRQFLGVSEVDKDKIGDLVFNRLVRELG